MNVCRRQQTGRLHTGPVDRLPPEATVVRRPLQTRRCCGSTIPLPFSPPHAPSCTLVLLSLQIRKVSPVSVGVRLTEGVLAVQASKSPLDASADWILERSLSSDTLTPLTP